MNKLKFNQNFSDLSELIIYFVRKDYKNVYFEIKENLNYLLTFNKFEVLEKIFEEFLIEKKLNLFFDSLNKFLILKIHKNNNFCLQLIKSLIEVELFNIPLNNLINYFNCIFDSPEKDMIFDLIKIIKIQVFYIL